MARARFSAAPRMTSAIWISRANIILPVKPVVLPPGADAKTFAVGKEAFTMPARFINSQFLDGLDSRSGDTERRLPKSKSAKPGTGTIQYPPARLGHQPPALLGLPDPRHPLRHMRRCAGAGKRFAGDVARRCDVRQTGQSARPPSDLEKCRLPHMRQSRRGAKPTPAIPLSIQAGISRVIARPTMQTQPVDRRQRRITGCRSINMSAASNTRFCICSMRVFSRAP